MTEIRLAANSDDDGAQMPDLPPLNPDRSDPKQLWERFWETQPERFGEPSGALLRWIKPPAPGESLRAIDVACGNGRYAVALAQMGYTTAALEWTDSGVEETKRRCLKHGVEVEVVQANFLELANETHSYDLVFSSGLLEELTPPQQSIAVPGYANWARSGAQIVLRYCSEIAGPGTLVDNDSVLRLLDSAGVSVDHFSEDRLLKTGRAGLKLRAATIVATKR